MKVIGFFLFLILLVAKSKAKFVEGHIKTHEDWVFVSRFCFLSESGRYEYLIEYEKKYGDLQLLLYYDEPHQWHSVYKTTKTCQEKVSVLSVQDNQIVTLSARSPYFIKSGCTLRTVSRNQANEQSTTQKPATTGKSKDDEEIDSTYFDKFLKSTTEMTDTSTDDPFNSSSSSPSSNTTEDSFTEVDMDNFTDVDYKTLNFDQNSEANNLENSTEYRTEVEEMFEGEHENANRTKRQVYPRAFEHDKKQTILVSCHNTGTFTSARQRWWYIALANCGSTKGIDVRFKFKMTNGPPGDFWGEHFSADEMYIPPVLLIEILCYTFLLLAIFLCGLELKTRQLYHCTYRLFTLSATLHWSGVLLNSVTWAKYAMSGTGPFPIFGGFLTGASEIAFLLLLLLMAKGYTITRARLSTSSTVKITVFINLYIVVYISLYVYQSEAFDPGEVLNLYESGPGYGIAGLRCFAWAFFIIGCIMTCKKFPEKRQFYMPFLAFGSFWILSAPILIFLIVGNLDAWVRESVCFMAFAIINYCGFCVFMWLTWPSRANKSFPYHVKTNHIGIANTDDDGSDYPRHTYEPSQRVPDATIIIPLSRRTEEFVTSTTGIYNAGFVRDMEYLRSTSNAPHSIPQQCMITQRHHRLPSPAHEPPPLMSITNDRLYGKDTLNNDDDDDSDTLETESGIAKHSADTTTNNRMSSFESEESVVNETGRRQTSQDNDSGHLSLEVSSTSPNSNENSSTPFNESLESNKPPNSPDDNLPAILKDNTFKAKAPNKIILDPIKLPSLMNSANNTTNHVPSNPEVPRHLFTVKRSDQ